MKMNEKGNKVGIIGVGDVGANLAFALVISGIVKSIVLIDTSEDIAVGQAMDLNHAISLTKPARVWAGKYSDLEDADIIVITAGASQKKGETRLDLTSRNVKITHDIVEKIIKFNKNGIILMVTNPVDVLTYVALKASKFPINRVFGSGTLLDSARFRALLSEHCKIDPRNIHAYVIGEHGDSEVVVWSTVNIGGALLSDFCSNCNISCNVNDRLEITNKVKNAAYEIIKYKGSTSYAIGLSILRIIESILRDENSVLPVSTYVENYHGVSDITISVPCIVNNTGISRLVNINLYKEEEIAFRKSAEIIKKAIENIEYNN
jgi:L-lactate dehydrogenase